MAGGIWECCGSEVSCYSVDLQEVVQDLQGNENYKKRLKLSNTKHCFSPLLLCSLSTFLTYSDRIGLAFLTNDSSQTFLGIPLYLN